MPPPRRPSGGDVRFRNRRWGWLPFPFEADADKISAEASTGVVTIRIPKKPGAMPRKVPVQSKE